MALIYDGIHYDALYDIAVDGKEVTLHSAEDKRLFFLSEYGRFSTTNCSISSKALMTAQIAKASHNYTDTSGFSLK